MKSFFTLVGLLMIVGAYFGAVLMVKHYAGFEVLLKHGFQTAYQLGAIALFIGIALLAKCLEAPKKC
jgi:hypothetical protein